MRKRRNRRLKTWRHSALWSVVLLGIALLLMASVGYKLNAPLSQVHVKVTPIPGARNLIEVADVEKIVQAHLGYDVRRSAIKDLDIASLEQRLDTDKRVLKSQIHVDGKYRLHIQVEQRQPILRVMTATDDYYLDQAGVRIDALDKTALRVPIATGYVGDYERGYLQRKQHVLKDLHVLASEIRKQPFLQALIEQIHVNKGEDLVLVPKIGHEKILFGTADEIDEKLENLVWFYKEGLVREGWNKYSHINLEYDGLVYATLKNP